MQFLPKNKLSIFYLKSEIRIPSEYIVLEYLTGNLNLT